MACRSFDYMKLAERRWASNTVNLLGEIKEHQGRQQLYLKQKTATLEALIDIAKAQSTEASNRIEGIVTTDDRVRQLLADKTAPHNRAEEEIAGYRDVLNMIHESAEYIPISPNHILQLHRDLFRYTNSSQRGQFKTTANQIVERHSDGTQIVLFEPVDPAATPRSIADICEQYTSAISSGINPLLLIPEFILDFLCIHPFFDGNGRMSRLLTTLLLYRSDFLVGRYISLEKTIERTKETYYEALRLGNRNWHNGTNDSDPFRDYLLGVLLDAYREFERRVEIVASKRPALEQVRDAAKEKIGRFSKRDIMEILPGLSRASIENSLSALVKTNELHRHGQGRSTCYTRND